MDQRNRRFVPDVIEGQTLAPMPAGTGTITIESSSGNAWRLNAHILSSHVLAIGSIGSGKSNLLYHVVRQVIDKITPNDVLIFFDSKGDFLRRFYRLGDYVIGNSAEYSGYQLSRWNLYRELDQTGSIGREDTIREISTSLFRKRIDESRDPTFASGARDIFAALVEAQLRSGDGNQDNAGLRHAVRQLDIRGIKDRIERHADLRWVNMYMHSEGSATTQSFLSPLGSVVNDVFSVHFAEAGDFSIRNALRDRGGKSIFLEYDIANSNLIDTVYTVLLDLASKEALRIAGRAGYVYFILDEFPLIPQLTHVDNLLNFGRTRGVRVIAGIQNVNQVKNMYGDLLGTSILSGFSTYLAFRLFDAESRRLVSERHGKNRKLVRTPYADAHQAGSQVYEQGNAIEDWDIVALKIGECIISLPHDNPYRFHPRLYPEPGEQITLRPNAPRITIRSGSH